MKIINNLLDNLYDITLFHQESKVFIFLCLIAYLFGLLKKVGTYISISQGALLVVGLRSIKCMKI